MATENYFEKIADNQKQMMESWVDYSQRVMAQIQDGAVQGKDGQELFSEWYQQQKELMEGAIGSSANPQEAMGGAVENYRKMMETQLAYTQKWMEISQQQMTQMMPQGDGQWGQTFGQNNKLMEEWIAQTNQFIRGQMFPFMSLGSLPRMGSVTDAYQSMQKFWEPIYQQIQTGNLDQSQMQDWLSPKFYQGMMGKLANFNLPDTMQTMAKHTTTMFADYNSWLSEQISGFTQNFPQPFGLSGGQNPWMNMIQEVQSRMEKAYAPLTMMNQGKQSKMMDLIREAQGEYINFAVKGTEFQLKLMEAGQKALPEAMQKLSNEYKQGGKLPDYDLFFNTFVGLVETYLIDIFETEEYAALQNELSMSGVKIKNRMDKFMELALEGAPFTMRSETEELSKEVVELKRKLRTLEKALNEAKSETPAPSATPKKATRSSTASKTTKTTKRRSSSQPKENEAE